jgi:hypothetical protein
MTSDSLSLPRTTRKSKLKTRAKEATLWATTNSQLGQKMNMPHSSEEVMRKEEISLREKEPENVVLEETHAHLLSQNLHQNQSCQLLRVLTGENLELSTQSSTKVHAEVAGPLIPLQLSKVHISSRTADS